MLRSDLVAEHIGGTNAKTEKIFKKAEGRVLFADEAYTLSSTSGKDYGKEAIEAMMAKMNANIDGKTKNPIFIFAGYPCEMEDFLRVNPGLSRRIPNFLQFNDYMPMELAEITNKILLTYEMSYPHGVLDMFVDCFASLPKEIRAKWNGGLCSLLLDYIQNERVKRLDLDCSIQDINRFKKQDIELGIACFLRDKSSGDQKFSDQGTMTHNTELCNKWIQTAEVIMNIPGVGAVFWTFWTVGHML